MTELVTPKTAPEQPRGRRPELRSKGALAVAGVVLMALIGGSVAYSLGAFEGTPIQTVAGGGDEPNEVPVVDEAADGPTTLFDDPSAFLGKELSLTVIVDKIVDPNSFRVVSEDPDAESLLVAYSGSPVLSAGALVDVDGKVTRFTPAAVNGALGAELPEAMFDLSDDEYVFVANAVAITLDAPVAKGGGEDPDLPAQVPVVTTVAAPAPVVAAPYVPTTSSDPAAPSGGTSGGTSGGSGGTSGSGGGSGSGSSGTSTSAVAFTPEPPTSGQYSDEAEFRARLTRDGRPIEGAELTFELRGQEIDSYIATTDHEGIASVTAVLSAPPGSYRLVAIYNPSGDRRAKDASDFVIEKDATSLEVSSEGEHDSDQEGGGNGNGNDEGRTDTLTAHLVDPDTGAGLEGRTVYFYGDGELLGSAVTDSNGVATLESDQKNSRDGLEARFEGDDFYLGSTDT